MIEGAVDEQYRDGFLDEKLREHGSRVMDQEYLDHMDDDVGVQTHDRYLKL